MDVAVIETGNGGDLVLNGNDFASQGSWGNMIYFALFGGNVEGSTKENRLATEQDFTYWANNLCFRDNQSAQFNSETEAFLMKMALTSSNRVRLQQVVENDLEFLKGVAKFDIIVKFPGLDNVEINIRELVENSNSNIPDVFREYIFIWNVTKRQLGDFSINDFSSEDFFV